MYGKKSNSSKALGFVGKGEVVGSDEMVGLRGGDNDMDGSDEVEEMDTDGHALPKFDDDCY